MWYLKKIVNISAAHFLRNDTGPCSKMHGHNLKITVFLKGVTLDKIGMIMNLSLAKDFIMKYDHTCLNDHPEFSEGQLNPTMENFTKYVAEQIPYCYRVEVQESPNNIIMYEAL